MKQRTQREEGRVNDGCMIKIQVVIVKSSILGEHGCNLCCIHRMGVNRDISITEREKVIIKQNITNFDLLA